MKKYLLILFSFYFSFLPVMAQAQFRCDAIFQTENLPLTPLEEVISLFTLYTGDRLTPDLLAELSQLKAFEKVSSKLDLLGFFGIEKYRLPGEKISVRWRKTDLSNADAAAKALVRFGRLLAFEKYDRLRQQKAFFAKLTSYRSDVITRIDNELYMKAVLSAEGYLQKSWKLSRFLPWRIFKLQNLQIDSQLTDVLDQQGLEAFHAAVSKRYGWRVATSIVKNTAQRIMEVSTVLSIAFIYYLMHGGDDYFDKALVVETGLEGDEFNKFERIMHESGMKSPEDVVKWFNSQKFTDPDMQKFVNDLNVDFKK